MKRIFAFLLALATAAVLLTGCHHGQMVDPVVSTDPTTEEKPSFAVPESFDTTKNFELTFWAKSDTNKVQTNTYKKAIEEFQKLYPNITVKLKIYTDYARIYSDVITNISTGTTPNVCITYPDHIATYATGKDTVTPLDNLIADPKYGLGGSEVKFASPGKEDVIAEYLNEGVINGVSYALPFMRSTEACYVNKTYVEKLGYTLPETLTWDFIWEVSEKATEKDENGLYKVNGQKVLIPFIYKSTDNMLIQMLWQKNAAYSKDNGEILVFNDTTKGLLKEIEKHGRTGAFSTFAISSYPANYLNAGQCIFAIDSTAGSTWMGTDAPLLDISEDALVEFETAVMTVPQFDPQTPKMISQGPSVCVFQKEDPQEVLAAWLFTQFLLTEDIQFDYATTEGYIPVTHTTRDSERYREYLQKAGEDNDEHYAVKIAATKLLLDNVQNTFVTPVFNGSANLRSACTQMIEQTTRAARSGQTTDDAFYDKLFTDMVAQYHLILDPSKGK